MNELVSIIMPSYGSEKFIEGSIKSVLGQTYKKWELIIVDDCSLDNSNEIIEMYCNLDERIRLVKLKENSGPAVARNTAIENAKGRYIAFLDADDLWKKEKLEKQINFMNKNNLTFSYSSYDLVDEKDRKIGTFITKKSISYDSMLKTSSVGCLTAIYDVGKLGKIYMNNVGHEDYVLWLQILKKINYTVGIIEPLATYRIMKKSVSSNKLKVASYQWKIYREVEKLSFLKSFYYFVNYALNGILKYK